MRESLYDLLALQEVDNDIDKLRRHKRDYPIRIKELRDQIAALKEDRRSKEERLAEREGAFRHFQQQLQAAKDDLAKHQERLLQIKTNREYDAVQQEIVALQHAADEYEVEMLKVDEEANNLRRELQDEEAAYREKNEEHEREIADLEEKTRVIDDEVAKTMERRRGAAEKLSPRMLTVYDRVRRGRPVAVVRVMRRACSGCWRSLPPQRINELRMSNHMVVCEGCGRILVWDDRDETGST